MKMKELVYALQISESMAYRLKKQGMPTHSIEAAEKWRAKHLDPVRTKEHRIDGNTGGKATTEKPPSVVGAAPAEPGEFWDILERWLCVELPPALFDPFAIAAAAADAGFSMTGAQAIRLGQHLFNSYMTVLDGGRQVVGFEIPERLNFPPKSEAFASMARLIDGTIEYINTRVEDKAPTALSMKGQQSS